MAPRFAFQQLPYDVIREVVLYTYTRKMQCVGGDLEISFDLQVPSPPIPASQVCRSWRNALLSDPTMWSSLFIPYTKPSGVLELLNRSGSALLTVFLIMKDPPDMDDEETDDMLRIVFQQIHRFKVLRLQINPRFFPFTPEYDRMQASIQNVLSYLRLPAPQLRIFSFWYKNVIFNGHDLHEGVREDVITDVFFSGDMPNLQQLHYRLHPPEPRRPEFRNLSELYISLRGLDMQPLFELIASSPRVKLIHVSANYWLGNEHVLPDVTYPDLNLPCLQSLTLSVFDMSKFFHLFLIHVTFPPDLKWSITSHHWADFNNSPSVLRLLSGAHFASLRLDFDSGFIKAIHKEEPSFNELQLLYLDGAQLKSLWPPFIHSMQSSRITHIHIIFQRWSVDYLTALQATLPVCDLESLTVEQQCDNDWSWLACIMILTPILKRTMEYVGENVPGTGVIDTKQGPGLEFMRSVVASLDNDAISSDTAAISCPHLRKLNLKLNQPLSELPVILLRLCVDLRQEERPLQMSIHCPTLDNNLRRMLCPEKNSPIQVSVDSANE